MTLTLPEKIALTQQYEPILHYHPSEKHWPVDPENYIRRCAMWCNKPPAKDKRNWGDCTHEIDWPFPRQPLIAEESLTTDPADTDPEKVFIGTPDENNFRQYLVSNSERELFLQLRGRDWFQGGPDTSDTVAAVVAQVRPGTTSNPPPYFVDVRDQDTVGSIPTDPGSPVPPGFSNALQALYPTGFWMLTFILFYDYHEEFLTDCEVDSEVLRSHRTGEPLSEFLHGSYAGDWHAVTVFVSNPGAPPPPGSPTGTPPLPASPLNLSDDAFPDPDYVGFSRRARGVFTNVSANLVETRNYTFMSIASVAAGEVGTEGRHAKVYVSLETHNNYATPGNNVAPKSDGTLPFPVEVIDTCIAADNLADVFEEVEVLEEDIDRAKDQAKTTGVGLGKVLGGAAAGAIAGAFGGGVGAAVGAVVGLFGGGMAAVAEGLGGDGPTPLPPLPPTGPESVPDVGPTAGSGPNGETFGLVAVPEVLLDQLSEELEGKATHVLGYGDGFEQRIVDRDSNEQLWWQPDASHPVGYQGKWGVISERDPFDRRSGTAIPSFEASFVNALLTSAG